MFLTRSQASITWCPMSRIVRDETASDDTGRTLVAGVNRDALSPQSYSPHRPFPQSCRCLADKCAMWRWADNATPLERTHSSINAQASRRGYCGLAGVPVKE